jgi:hypothetical protein
MEPPRPDDDSVVPRQQDRTPSGQSQDVPDWSNVVIPDDLSELADEVAEVRAELARGRREARVRRLVPLTPGRRRRLRTRERRMLLPLVLIGLVLLSACASLVLVLFPTAGPIARTAAPITDPSTPEGTVGGLVPDVVVTDASGHAHLLRTLRPSVLLLVGPACACGPTISEYAAATADGRVQLVVVGGAVAPVLPPAARSDHVLAVADRSGAVAASLRQGTPPVTPEAVLVGSDGAIARVLSDARNTATLGSDLAALD